MSLTLTSQPIAPCAISDRRKQSPMARMEQQRFLAADQELIERETGRWRHLGDEGRDPKNPVSDLVDARRHECPPVA
jgi:hypothetical protein